LGLLLEILFWASVAGVFVSYVGYPLLLLMLRERGQASASSESPASRNAARLPMLSVIIAARNEAGRLPAKLDDVLAQDYPADRLQLIVVSDGSTDATADIARAHAGSRVECLELEERMGKEAAQVRGIRAARGDILVFTDVSTRIGGLGLRGIAAAFDDPVVGAISSEDRFVTADGQLAGEGLYVRYEMWLRRLESRVAGLVGLSGSLFAVRRELCDEWPTDVPSDFVVALRCARRGLKAVSIAGVHGLYTDLKRDSAEFARKRRTAIRGMAGVSTSLEVLRFSRFGMFAVQVWMHKLARWAVPWFMALAFFTNVMLALAAPVYTWSLAAQCVAYGAAGAAAMMPSLRRLAPIRILYFFVLSNMALAAAALDFVRGRRVVQWEPSVR
jgi:cellulose synthase/poly-beta-1,6-N-acetylglucosamine synthase-like glycosyltransferase